MARKKRSASKPTCEHWYLTVEDWGFDYTLYLYDVRERRKYGTGFEYQHIAMRTSMTSPRDPAGSCVELLLLGNGKRIEEIAEGTVACGSVSKRRDGVLEALVSVNAVAFAAIELALVAGKIREVTLGVRDFRRSKGLVYSMSVSSKETDPEER